MNLNEIVTQVTELYPDLKIFANETDCRDRHVRQVPDENLLFLAAQYLIRSYFVGQPTKPTPAQADQVESLSADLKYFKSEILKRNFKGRFAIMFLGFAFVIEIDCYTAEEDWAPERLYTHCIPIGLLTKNSQEVNP